MLRKVILSVLGSPVHKRCWKTGQCPAEGYGDATHKTHKLKQREASLFTGKRKDQGRGGVLIHVVRRKWSQILLRCTVKGREEMDTILIAVRHIPIRYKERTLHSEGGQALEEVAERGCGISPLRDCINLTGQDPKQPD